MRTEPYEVDLSHGDPVTVRLWVKDGVYVDLAVVHSRGIGTHLYLRTSPGRLVLYPDGTVSTLRVKATEAL